MWQCGENRNEYGFPSNCDTTLWSWLNYMSAEKLGLRPQWVGICRIQWGKHSTYSRMADLRVAWLSCWKWLEVMTAVILFWEGFGWCTHWCALGLAYAYLVARTTYMNFAYNLQKRNRGDNDNRPSNPSDTVEVGFGFVDCIWPSGQRILAALCANWIILVSDLIMTTL